MIVVRLLEIEECPIRCDDDCEVGQYHCAYIHEPKHKRAHDPNDCPAKLEDDAHALIR